MPFEVRKLPPFTNRSTHGGVRPSLGLTRAVTHLAETAFSSANPWLPTAQISQSASQERGDARNRRNPAIPVFSRAFESDDCGRPLRPPGLGVHEG
jgi:hypothetical protein